MKRKMVSVIVLLVFLVGCGGMLGTGDNSKPLTPKAYATLAMNTYKAELADLQSLSKLTNATPAQKELFKAKQSILVKMKPTLDLYMGIVDDNGVPDQTLQYKLNDFINQLVAAGGVK